MDTSNLTSTGASDRSSASPWTEGEDRILMEARQKGLNWAVIANKHFPSKTSNACRKRHERLMDKRKSQDNWDVEALAQAYMEVREHMWQILASKLSQNWQAVEGKVNVSCSPSSAGRVASPVVSVHAILLSMWPRDSKQVSSGVGPATSASVVIPEVHVHDRGAAHPRGINRSSPPLHWLTRAPTCLFRSAWRKASRRCKTPVARSLDEIRPYGIPGPTPTTAAVTSMTITTAGLTIVAATVTTMAAITAAKISCPRIITTRCIRRTPGTCPLPRHAPPILHIAPSVPRRRPRPLTRQSRRCPRAHPTSCRRCTHRTTRRSSLPASRASGRSCIPRLSRHIDSPSCVLMQMSPPSFLLGHREAKKNQ